MTNKLFGTKQITHLIYGLVMLLPFLSILGRTTYTIVNKNAKDSYSTNVVKETIQINNFSDIQQGKLYEYVPVDKGLNNTSPRFTFTSLSFNFYEKYPTAPVHEYDSFLVIGTNRAVYWYYGDDRWTGAGNLNFEFGFVAGIQATSGNTFGNFNIYTTNYVELKLDNAFEYSLSQFTKDNNIGSVDFFSWFTDLFLDQDNSHNAIYLNFVNWYMNYALLTSSGYLLFLCLLWFVNYVRRILDKSMNHDMGGF